MIAMEYEPTEWIDKTATTPGTKINRQRMMKIENALAALALAQSGTSGTGEVTITTASFTITEPGDYVAAVSTVVTLPTETDLSLTPGQFIVVRRYGVEWFYKVASLDGAGSGPATEVTPLGPVWTDDVVDGGGTWSTPTQTGVTYTPAGVDVQASPDEVLQWTATPEPGYDFPAGADASWSHTFPGVPAGPPEVTYLDGAWDPTQAATWTFPAMNLGDPATDRVILVAVLIDHGNRDLTSVTIGGVTADLIATGSAVTYTRTVQLAAAVVPTGTSGDVVVTAGGWGTNQIGLLMQMARLVNVEAVPYLAQVNPVEHDTYASNATVPATPAGNLVVVAGSSILVPGPLDETVPTDWTNGAVVTPLGPPVGNEASNESAVFFGTFTSDGNTRAVDGRTRSTTDTISRAGGHAWAVYSPRSS